jgi:hypothetical protein
MAQPIPLRNLDRRLPQAGRIRAGRKVPMPGGKTRPGKLTTFRFTSKDEVSLNRVAELYGGDVLPWSDPLSPDRFELTTEASEIKVALPPDPLGGTPVYEMWSRGGCERRCDGETCTLSHGAGPDGSEPKEVPCLCATRGELACKLTTRLAVILPDVRFLGVWRLDSRGKNAAKELPGMVEGVQAMQAKGIVRAVLRLDYRVEMHRGRKQEFVVPMLGVDATPEELAAGSVRLGLQDGGASAPAVLEAPSPGCPGCASPYSLHRRGCPNEAPLNPEVLRPTEIITPVEGQPIVLGETPDAPVVRDPEMVRHWLDALTTAQRAKVLVKAREKAEEVGWDVPTAFEAITLELADQVLGNGTP